MPSISSTQVDALDKILTSAVESNRIPPTFFAVSSSEKILYSKSVGKIDASRSIDENTVQMIFSQTKLITSIAALQLIERGKLSLSTPVVEYFPELANPVVVSSDGTTQPAKTPIIVQHLFNHSSGLYYYLNIGPSLVGLPDIYTHEYKKGDGPSAVFKILRQNYPGVPLKWEPGTKFEYGTSVDVLGYVVEKISGLSLEEYFKEHIFGPLGLTASFHGDTLGENRLPMMFRKPDGTLKPYDEEDLGKLLPTKNVNVYHGGGGLYASQTTYLAVLRNILQILDGTATNPILSVESAQSLFAHTLPSSALPSLDEFARTTDNQFGNGLRVNTADRPGMRKAGSGTWGGWANTYFWIDPKSGIAAVVGTQLAPPGDVPFYMVYAELEAALYAGLQQ